MKMLPDGKMTGTSTELKEMSEMVITADSVNPGTSWEPNNVNMAGSAEAPEYAKEVVGVMAMMAVKELHSLIKLQDCSQITDKSIK